MIQNMKNIKSKFLIDLKYFDQHLVNTNRFNGKLNSRISGNAQKVHFSKIKNFQTLLNQNLEAFSMYNVFWKVLKGLEEYYSSANTIFQKIPSIFC